MAKIRVYEFARDLNMTNRELLDKIRDLDIDVSSHMSSLDEDVVAMVKSALFGEKDDQLEEKRIRPTVIRRRKVVPPQEPETPTAQSDSALEPESPPVETEEKASDAAGVKAPSGKKPAVKKPAVKKRKPIQSARIIAKPKTETPETPPTVTETELVDETPANEATAPPVGLTDGDPTANGPASAPPPADEPPKAPVAKTKKAKKEAAAKIIKLPTRPKVSSTPAGPPSRPSPRTPQPVDAPSTAKDRKKKGWRKKDGEADGLRFTKKKGGFRKREIVEGAALYSGKMRGRRGRKGSKLRAMPAGQKTQITTAKAIKRRVKVDETIVLSELAKRMGIKANEMIVKLMGMGVMATVNQTIDYDTAVLVAGEFDYEVERASFEEENRSG
jgi:translation initiation factor IF-2